jgi:hypothetical protein
VPFRTGDKDFAQGRFHRFAMTAVGPRNPGISLFRMRGANVEAGHWRGPEQNRYLALYRQAMATREEAARRTMFHDMQRILHEEVLALPPARAIAAGAFVAIPHPGWYALTTADANTLEGAHAVEVYNHTSQLRTERGDGVYLADQLLAEGRRITLIAVDDAHFVCPDAFGGWVMVKAEANEPDALLAALKAGQFYATQGPAIHDITWEEDSVEITCSPAASIMVLGRGSRAAQSVAPFQTRARLSIAALRAGGFARVVVADAQGRRAWSNPIHFPN